MGRGSKKKTGSNRNEVSSETEWARRIQPIYDALDARNIKKTLKLIADAQKKWGHLPLLSALNALALTRKGESAEALQALAALKDQGDLALDERVLQIMLIAYKELRVVHEASLLYEKAVERKPKDKDTALALYFNYGREMAYGKQQRMAIKLYKHFQDTRYLYWCAIAVLCMSEEEQKANSSLVKLSDMMIQRGIRPGQELHEADLKTYLHILELQDKTKAALDVASGPLAAKWVDWVEKSRFMAAQYVKLEQWAPAAELYMQLLTSPDHESNCNDWEYLSGYITCQARLSDDARLKRTSPTTIALRDMLRTLHNKDPARSPGPFLALMHLETIVSDSDDAALIVLLLEYFTKFGHKPGVFWDLRRFVCHLSPTCQAEFVSKVTQQLNANILEEKDEDERQLEVRQRKLVAIEMFQRLCRDQHMKVAISSDAAAKHASRLFAQFHRMETRYEHLDSEQGMCDGLILIACHYLLDGYARSHQTQFILDALYLCETALSMTPHNFEIKLLAARMYCHPAVGAAQAAMEIVASLDIKQIQLDTASHLFVSDAVRFGLMRTAQTWCEHVVDYHGDNLINGPELLAFAYRQHNYTKIVEFADFNRRLQRSLQRAVCQVELVKTDLFFRPKTAEAFHEWTNDILRFNPLENIDDSDVAENKKQLVAQGKELSAGRFEATETLVCNRDHSILNSWDHSDSSLPSILNAPPAAIVSSSFATTRPHSLQQAQAEGVQKETVCDAFSLQYVELNRRVPALLRHGMDGNSPAMRQQLFAIKPLLQEMKLVDLDGPPSTALTSFDDYHWRLFFLAFETSACISECVASSTAMIGEIGQLPVAELDMVLGDHAARWEAIDRQLGVLLSLYQAIVRHLKGTFFQPVAGPMHKGGDGDDENKQQQGECKNKSKDSARLELPQGRIALQPVAVAQLTTFTTYANTMLTCLVQMWCTFVPSKHAFTKKWNKKAQHMGPEALATERHILAVYAQTRTSLKALIGGMKELTLDLSFIVRQTAFFPEGRLVTGMCEDGASVSKSMIAFFNEEKGAAAKKKVHARIVAAQQASCDGLYDGIETIAGALRAIQV